LVGKPAYHMYKNNVDWAPSVNLGHNKLRTGKSESAQEWDKRAGRRKRKRQEAEQEVDQRAQDETLAT